MKLEVRNDIFLTFNTKLEHNFFNHTISLQNRCLVSKREHTKWLTDRWFFWMQCILFFWPFTILCDSTERTKMAGLVGGLQMTQSWCPCGKHITQGVRAHAQTVWPQLWPDWVVLKVFMFDEVWLELWGGYSPEALQQWPSGHRTFHYSPWQSVACSSGYPHPYGTK